MVTLYDITRTLHPSTAVWDGDTPCQVQPVLEMAHGHAINLTRLTLSAHSGTHADAPYHYTADGLQAAALPLLPYVGRARVVSVPKTDGFITLDDLAHTNLRGGERLLIHTPLSELDDSVLMREFAALSVTLIDHLAALGYVLIGTDAISVDPYTSTTLDAHHALRRGGLFNLESITLAGVPDGDYELMALPLKLAGACASPVRAVLKSL